MVRASIFPGQTPQDRTVWDGQAIRLDGGIAIPPISRNVAKETHFLDEVLNQRGVLKQTF